MSFDPEKLLSELLKNQRIANRAQKLKLTKQQLLDALPILIDMNDQIDDHFTKYLTSFYLSKQGEVKRMEVRSTYWEKFRYLEHILTLPMEQIDFEDDKEFAKMNSRRAVIKEVKKYLQSDKYERGMYLCGPMGVGKTFILKRIARKLARAGYTVGFISVPTFFSKVKKSFSLEDPTDPITILKSVDFLFLDDIGAEPITSWFRDERLLPILDARMQRDKTTFFSSNHTISKLEQVESRTMNQKFRDYEKAARLSSRVRALAVEIEIKEKFAQ